MRKQGYELCHLESCGPRAISDVYKHFNKERAQFDIGKEIQDETKINYREILSAVHHDFSKITCPPELLRYLKYKGFKIKTVDNLNEVGIGEVAIVLIRGKNDLRDWHYITYPTYSKRHIREYFGDRTIIKKAYILEL